MSPDILTRKEKNFVLWRPANVDSPPALIIGQLKLGAPILFVDEQRFTLQQSDEFDDLWLIAATDCNLIDGEVYHYWFEVNDAHPDRSGARIKVTDPFAFCVDWRLYAAKPEGDNYNDDDCYPASIIKFSSGNLIACDANGETAELNEEIFINLSPNKRLVIYELPTAWSQTGVAGERAIGVGTFRDVTALIEPTIEAGNFSGLAVTEQDRSYLTELGINALELLPPADSFYAREWGYGTTNFFAPDFELGFPANYSWQTPNRDLKALIAACHANGIRFFVDVVMAFAKNNAYLAAATDDFFMLHPEETKDDPDAHNSRGNDDSNLRNGFGSSLFRYAAFKDGYDPVAGEQINLSPARQLLKASLLHWMNSFHINGIRMDSVENIANWDFIQEYKDLARTEWRNMFGDEEALNDADERFLVVGEELSLPLDLLHQQRLDGLWNENFKRYIRAALIGEIANGETSFDATVRKAIDCRGFGFTDLTQAVIYLTSHDVEGAGNERLYNFLLNNNVPDISRRIKLAFVCLLTGVGIPMILAGDEFADEHDLFDKDGNVDQNGGKQIDPVNFSRAEEDWRKEIKEYVSRLIKFRTTSNALAVNDTEFIHVDLNDGKRVFAWRRGMDGSDDVVIVVANFSDFGTDVQANSNAEYLVNNWSPTPEGKKWIEITQRRDVPQEWIGREPVFPWEAKVYALM